MVIPVTLKLYVLLALHFFWWWWFGLYSSSFPLASIYLQGLGLICFVSAGFRQQNGFLEFLGHEVVADAVQAAVGRGNAPRQGKEVHHDLAQETASSNILHYEPEKYPKVGWQKAY